MKTDIFDKSPYKPTGLTITGDYIIRFNFIGMPSYASALVRQYYSDLRIMHPDLVKVCAYDHYHNTIGIYESLGQINWVCVNDKFGPACADFGFVKDDLHYVYYMRLIKKALEKALAIDTMGMP